MAARDENLSIRSTVLSGASGATVELSLAVTPIPRPGKDEILVRVEAAPINPSDLGGFLAGMDMETATDEQDYRGNPLVRGRIPPAAFARGMAARVDTALPIGNEGAGVVVGVGEGSSEAAQDLLGKTVAILGGAMYTQYRVVKAELALPLLPGTSARDGASAFVNPLTVLGMIETMKDEGHTAIIHTAAASQLGQMLVRACAVEGIPLVNVVRRPAQVQLLRSLGAEFVVDSSSDDFTSELVTACEDSGATLGFDATGGGTLASQLLSAMEAAAVRREVSAAVVGNRYGSSVFKQVYIYGGLQVAETRLDRSYGPNFLERVGTERVVAARARVAREITSIFATTYSGEVSLREALTVSALHKYSAMGTAEKFLITPHKLDAAGKKDALDVIGLAAQAAKKGFKL